MCPDATSTTGLPIKVLQINKAYFPVVGGVETIVQTLAEGLKDRTDMQVLVCNTRRGRELGHVGGVEVVRSSSLGIKYSMPLSLSFLWDFRRLAADKDILHFHMPFPLGDLACLLFRPRAKVIVWWHSEVVRQKKLMALYRPIMRMFLKRADRIIVATPNHLAHTAALASHLDKCVVIPFGIDAGKYRLTASREAQVRALRAKFGPRIALFVGRLIYYKGVEFLVEAMKQVDCHLLIVGDGALRKHLDTMVADLQVGNRVTFLGALSDEELAVHLNACDLFVFPSVARSEAFGIVQLEAMACGKPVINTQLETGVPWVSVDSETGISVPPGDSSALAHAMNRLFQDDALRKKYGENALQRVKAHFQLNSMLDRVVDLYRTVSGK